jgi:hypothetical protein
MTDNLREDKNFIRAVRESRVFYRRRLATSLTRGLIKELSTTTNPRAQQIAEMAIEMTDKICEKLWTLEEDAW